MATDDPPAGGIPAEGPPSLRGDLLDLARRPFTGDGPFILLALAVPHGLTVVPIVFLPPVLELVYLGCLAGCYFQTVDHVGNGSSGLPFSAEATTPWEIAAALGRGLACLAVAIGPAALWQSFVPGAPLGQYALLALGIALAPAAIVAASVSKSGLAALWPPFWARIIAGAPAAYGKLVGFFAVSSAVWALGTFLAASTVGLVPVVGPFLVGVANAALALLQAVLVGGFLRRNWREIGVTA